MGRLPLQPALDFVHFEKAGIRILASDRLFLPPELAGGVERRGASRFRSMVRQPRSAVVCLAPTAAGTKAEGLRVSQNSLCTSGRGVGLGRSIAEGKREDGPRLPNQLRSAAARPSDRGAVRFAARTREGEARGATRNSHGTAETLASRTAALHAALHTLSRAAPTVVSPSGIQSSRGALKPLGAGMYAPWTVR